ncbi:hypothetical protein CO230_08415 [Chryseobacterium sp. 6424]|uniref:hypothetical protein n=1 Tax=Chryseobacterium sp. 6424 TaxID=2039166 RepID=UPI000EFC9462|nr:hypothetical protein [Chryseobacterium sp. 6424]AYO58142.1 hypothetical protein CO230_08415 [Chryseobacterium sp. 6424]
MKKQLYIYMGMVLAFIIYNQFFQLPDERLNALINILFASFLFLYIGYMAFLVLKRLKRNR